MDLNIQDKDKVYIGETNFRNARRPFGIKRWDRGKHIYIIGKTGMGKTTLLENMVIQDIQHGDGVGVVDPHGEFAEKMLDFVPKERINDVIYFNPADLAHPIGFNIMENIDPDKRHLIASGLMSVFKKIWVDVWSARMEYILGNTILALLEYPGATLLSINRMLAHKGFRKEVVSRITDPVVRSFWIDEFAKYTDRYTQEALPAIQNKIGQFISNPLIRNIVGQEKSSFDMRRVMDERKILIVNLSKGRIGEENARLLGAMLITRLYLGAMSRVEITQESKRPDFYLYVDEFQNFASESFANILSEARKYHLNLTLAHQYIAQMDETVRDAVFGNIGTMIVFRVGAADAEFLEKEFTPEFSINDIVNLPFATVYLKLMIDGIASRPFSARTLAPFTKPANTYADLIIETSGNTYGRPRTEVETKIAELVHEKEEKPDRETSAQSFHRTQLQETRSPEQNSFHRERFIHQPISNSEETNQTNNTVPIEIKRSAQSPQDGPALYEAYCDICRRKTLVPFVPDGRRPVYCKIHRKERPPQREAGETRQFNASSPYTPPTLRKGEPVLRSNTPTQQQSISLKTLQRNPEKNISFSDQVSDGEKRAKAPDIASLRKTLQETLHEAQSEEDEEEEPPFIKEDNEEYEDETEEPIEEKTTEEQEDSFEEDKENTTAVKEGAADHQHGKVLRPGESIKF